MASSSAEANGMARVLAQLGTATGSIHTIVKACRGRPHVKSAGTWCDVQHGWNEFHSASQTMFEAIAEITNPETRLEYLFLAFYATRPTDEERKEFLPLAENREDVFTLARAMLTSKRFLFVQ